FENVPAFCPMTDVPVDVPDLGKIRMDVAYGGNFFGIVSADEIGLEICNETMSKVADLGVRIRDAANRQLKVTHPTQPHLSGIPLISFQSRPRVHHRLSPVRAGHPRSARWRIRVRLTGISIAGRHSVKAA